MRFEIPIFRQISLDLERGARELQVFWASVELLDVVDVRPMTLTQVEKIIERQQRELRGDDAVKPSRSTISQALNALVDAGYLQRRADIRGREGYRVPLSRDAVTHAPPPPRERRVRPNSGGVISEIF